VKAANRVPGSRSKYNDALDSNKKRIARRCVVAERKKWALCAQSPVASYARRG
jgi:hypothetical protein